MTKREVVRLVLDGHEPPYVPWSFSFTVEALEKLGTHYGDTDIMDATGNHIVGLGSDIGFFEDLGGDRVRDVFGVEWDRSIDRDIGTVANRVLTGPSLRGYVFPDPFDPRFFAGIPGRIARYGDRFRVYQLGFSLFERAWTMRGMEELLMDFIDHPGFVRELFDAIAEYNIAQVREALTHDIDAVYFGDDWGQQHGLIMGPGWWRTFIRPVLARMYAVVKDAGKYVMIHSCGDVDELFGDLVDIGLDCFNPFQPEVMDVHGLLRAWRGRLAFHGGISTQRTLPFGSMEDVQREVGGLIEAGRPGGYILSPAHAVEGDVPLDNMLTFMELAHEQPGFTP